MGKINDYKEEYINTCNKLGIEPVTFDWDIHYDKLKNSKYYIYNTITKKYFKKPSGLTDDISEAGKYKLETILSNKFLMAGPKCVKAILVEDNSGLVDISILHPTSHDFSKCHSNINPYNIDFSNWWDFSKSVVISSDQEETNFDRPSRYASREVHGMDVIDLIEHWNLSSCEGNILKYLLRDKGQDIEDLEKIKIYAERRIQQLKKNESS